MPPTPPLPSVETFSREEFLTNRWDYHAGEHVTILGPTGSGKTHLAYQLLNESMSTRLPALILVMKPRDKTVKKWSKTLRIPIVRSWPPVWSPWNPRKPRGHVLWPRHTFDPERDDATLYTQFRRGILHSYKTGNRIVFADEMAGITNELHLERETKAVWGRGRSMECGMWCASQRPREIPLLAYSSAQHLFLANDPDEEHQKRFAQIGGVDPVLVKAIVKRLRPGSEKNPVGEWLYIGRDGPVMCVVQP